MAEQLFQIGIKAIIRNRSGEVLLIGYKWKDREDLAWDLPGGRMDEGEDFMQALARELEEEVGITTYQEPTLFRISLTSITIPVDGKYIPLVRIAYEVEVDPAVEPRAVEEGSVLEWVSPQEAAKRLAVDFSADFVEALAKL